MPTYSAGLTSPGPRPLGGLAGGGGAGAWHRYAGLEFVPGDDPAQVGTDAATLRALLAPVTG